MCCVKKNQANTTKKLYFQYSIAFAPFYILKPMLLSAKCFKKTFLATKGKNFIWENI